MHACILRLNAIICAHHALFGCGIGMDLFTEWCMRMHDLDRHTCPSMLQTAMDAYIEIYMDDVLPQLAAFQSIALENRCSCG